MLRLVHNALELWDVPCDRGPGRPCLHARRGASAPPEPAAPVKAGRGVALALKMRMIRSANVRQGLDGV